MDRIPQPLPTATELTTAILTLSRTLQALRIKHGLIDTSAIFLHARAFSLPCLLPANITILIQPTQKISALELIHTLTAQNHASSFTILRRNGINSPKVVVKRHKDDIRGNLLVAFEIVDHWSHPSKRDAYDFRFSGNYTVPLMVGGEQVHVMSPEWLLRQKIQVWNEQEGKGEREKRSDEIGIRTLVDVLGFRGGRKVRFKGKREVEELRVVVLGMDGDDPGVLGSVVSCPEVFGPWWELAWVRTFGTIMGMMVLMVVLGIYGPENDV